MPSRISKSKSPFQANTKPPSKRDSTSGFEKAFADMTIKPLRLSTIPEVSSRHGSVSVEMPASHRVHTSQHALGDNARTYLEGMKPLSSSKTGSAAQTSRDAAARTFASKTGTVLCRSLIHSTHDAQMASRQTQIDEMSSSDRKTQDSWAQSMIQRSKCCPQKYGWNRVSGGYHCEGGHHYISDDLLSEGNGGLMLLKDPRRLHVNYGPYYPDPNRDGQFLYCGPDPRPRAAPEYMNELGSGNSSSGTFRPHRSVAREMCAASQAEGSQYGGSQCASQLVAPLISGSRHSGSQHGMSQLSRLQQFVSQKRASQLRGQGGV